MAEIKFNNFFYGKVGDYEFSQIITKEIENTYDNDNSSKKGGCISEKQWQTHVVGAIRASASAPGSPSSAEVELSEVTASTPWGLEPDWVAPEVADLKICKISNLRISFLLQNFSIKILFYLIILSGHGIMAIKLIRSVQNSNRRK